jgi:hypothetical protein
LDHLRKDHKMLLGSGSSSRGGEFHGTVAVRCLSPLEA